MRSYIKFLVWTAGILGAIGLFLYLALFDVWTVPTDDPQLALAVQPNLKAGDLVLVYRHSHPGWGNLVRCPDPDAPGRWVIGRIAAVSGDKLEIRSESMVVNNRAQSTVGACDQAKVMMTSPETHEEVELNCARREFAGMETASLRATSGLEPDLSVTVDRDRVFLVSDNIHFHEDSRDYGQINPVGCQHIVYRLWGAEGFDSERRLSVLW